MANELLNATGLDGPTNWSAWTGGVSVLSSGVGAEGRLVFSGLESIASDPVPLNGRTSVWAMAHGITRRFVVRFTDAAGETVEDIDLPILRRPEGPPQRGRPGGFAFAKGRVIAPEGATHFMFGVIGEGMNYLLKPYASADGLEPCVWQAGPHTNPDLNYPRWPAHLPALMDEGLQFDPIPTRKGYSGDSGVEATRRITRTRRYRMGAQLSLTTAERDVLMDFFDDHPGKFWFTRPDTRELCLAQWLAEGEPVDAGQLPGRRRTQIKLQLVVV
jgi:hypothetical protein